MKRRNAIPRITYEVVSVATEPKLIDINNEVEMAIRLPAMVSTDSSSLPADFFASADRILVESVSTARRGFKII